MGGSLGVGGRAELLLVGRLLEIRRTSPGLQGPLTASPRAVAKGLGKLRPVKLFLIEPNKVEEMTLIENNVFRQFF